MEEINSPLAEQLDRIKTLMAEGFMGGATDFARKLFNIRDMDQKKAAVLQYIKSGKNPNMLAAYSQFERENPAKADKYLEFYVKNPDDFPKWTGTEFVPTGETQWMGENAPMMEEVSRYRVLMEMSGEIPAVVDEVQGDVRLDQLTRKKINKDLEVLMKPTYFEEIPLNAIFNVLKKHGVMPLQEDGTEWEGMLMGSSSHTYLDLGLKSTERPVNDIPTYTPVSNAKLTLTWHKMGSGRWEVLAFIG